MKKISRIGIFLSVSILLLAGYGQLCLDWSSAKFFSSKVSVSADEGSPAYEALPSSNNRDRFFILDATEVRAEEQEEEEDDKGLALKKNLKNSFASIFRDEAPVHLSNPITPAEFLIQPDFSAFSSDRYLAIQVFRL